MSYFLNEFGVKKHNKYLLGSLPTSQHLHFTENNHCSVVVLMGPWKPCLFYLTPQSKPIKLHLSGRERALSLSQGRNKNVRWLFSTRDTEKQVSSSEDTELILFLNKSNSCLL
jgi:hypothetical protein